MTLFGWKPAFIRAASQGMGPRNFTMNNFFKDPILESPGAYAARDLWRALPMDKRIVMRWWQVPRAEIPTDRDARIDWLFDWWERIDGWVDENRPAEPGR